MTDSIRQQNIDKIDTRFKTILVTGGYKTNLGTHVFAWRDTEENPFSATEVPGLNYKDVTVDHEPLTFDKNLNTMSLNCEIAVIGDDEDIRECIYDLEKVIGTDPTFGGLALNCELTVDESDISHKENKIMVVKAILQIQYVNTVGSP